MAQLNDPPYPWRDRPPLSELAPYLAQAFTTGEPVHVPHLELAVVPDVVMLQAAANEEPTPGTVAVRRADGRTAYLYHVDPKQLVQ